MKKTVFDKRIPTVIALFILFISIGISTFLIQRGVFYVGKAAPDGQPKNFSITNITDISFTVLFVTTGLSESVVKMNMVDTGNSIILDDRDKKSGVKNKYFSHHISIHNLKAKSKYSFSLISAGKEYVSPTYTASTGVTINSPPPKQNPILGKVLMPDGSSASDTIIVALTDNSSPISSITNHRGEFIIPTNSLRDYQNANYINLRNDNTFDMSVLRQFMKTSVTASFLAAQNLPPITLLQQYIFIQEDSVPSIENPKLSLPLPKVGGKSITIAYPQSQETYTDLRPRFSGTALSGSSVSINVKGVFSKQILTTASGTWSYRPNNDFLPGRYTLIATSLDSNGKTIEASSQFTVLPQGSQILADQLNPTTSPTPTKKISPSQTPTSSPTPTITPTSIQLPSITYSPSPTINTPSPTLTIIPTIIPSPLPTMAISPTPYISPTNPPPIAKPGTDTNTITLIIIAVFLILAGVIIVFAL